MSTNKQPAVRGLAVGATTGLMAAALSIPLRSPDPILMNTLTVVIGALVVGVIGAVLNDRIVGKMLAAQSRPNTLRKKRSGAKAKRDAERTRRRIEEAEQQARKDLWRAMGIGFLIVLVGLIALQVAFLDNMITFGAPLAAIIFFGTAYLLTSLGNVAVPQTALIALPVIALAVGVGFQGLTDVESGDLALDDLGTDALQAQGSADPLTARNFAIRSGEATYTVPEMFLSNNVDVVAVGRTDTLNGSINLDGISEITIDLTTFRSDQSRRDRNVARLFASNPNAVFTSSGFEVPADVVIGETFVTSITGELTIMGTSQSVTWDVEGRIVDGVLQILGTTTVTMTEFGFNPPSVSGFVSVRDEARLEVVFSAVPQQ
jgi:polyisoprenoid-binding protein YceI